MSEPPTAPECPEADYKERQREETFGSEKPLEIQGFLHFTRP
jgi:hypothetical protein